MNKLQNLFVVACVALASMLVMQGQAQQISGSETGGKAVSKPTVVSTTSMISDIVSAVGGEKVTAKTVIAPGLDPHTYKPTRADIQLMASGDVIIYNGLMFEGKMTESFTLMGRKGKKVWAVSEEYEESDILYPDGADEHADPHIWMDVTLWIKSTDLVCKALVDIAPENKDYYMKNADAYKMKLTKLKAYVDKVMNTIPKEKRVLITAHDAFGYMAKAFGIQVRGVQGISTEDEASLKAVRDLAKFIVKNKIETVFIETSVSEKNIKALIEMAKSQGQEVAIGGTLFSYSAGEAGTYEGTYTGMIDHNATVLARSLGGEAPEKGFQGKLNGVK